MQSLRVNLPDDVAAKLRTLAERDYRAPRQQAAALLTAAIENALRTEPTGPNTRRQRDESRP